MGLGRTSTRRGSKLLFFGLGAGLIYLFGRETGEARGRSSSRRGPKLFLLGLGAGLMYLLDPQQGRTRRAKLQDRATAFLRRGAREAARRADYAKGQAEGLRHVAKPDEIPPNDVALKDKIESEVLSRSNYPKGQISVTAVGGVIELRGVCNSEEEISRLEQDVRKITGVVDVRNYLHLPNTPPPNK